MINGKINYFDWVIFKNVGMIVIVFAIINYVFLISVLLEGGAGQPINAKENNGKLIENQLMFGKNEVRGEKILLLTPL